MSLSRAARELGSVLHAQGRRRVPLERVRELLREVEPQVAASPLKRRRLNELLDELSLAGAVSLPKGRASYDRLEQPAVPRFVVLEGLPARVSLKAVGADTHPWRPELRWAAGLRPALRIDEMEALVRITEYLNSSRPEQTVVPMQERSLELFGEEKRLGALIRQRLFAAGHMTLDMLACREVHPPFVYTRISGHPNLLVVENSATYDTLRRVLEPDGPVGFLAYGAGKHFILSVSAALDLDPPPRRIVYFGDVDPDGLFIPTRATETSVLHGLPAVEPAACFYELLFRLAMSGTEPAPTDGLDDRTVWLPVNLRAPATALLRVGRRLAQEHVGLDALTGETGWRGALREQLA